jgi:hypothetical protein
MSRRPALPLLLSCLMLVSIARLWLMPLGSSFWVDETATAFVVHYGAQHPSFAVAPQVPASIYYVLPRAAEKLLGFSEAVYRLPSLLLMGLALWAVVRLAARLIHPQAAWFAAFACLALHGIDDQAADARPYALGTAAAALGVWFLVRWLDHARWRDALAFAAMAALLWRVHLLFAPFYLVFAIYALARLAREKPCQQHVVRWRQAAAVFGAVALALVPVAFRAADLFRHAASHVIVAPPTLRDLANSLKYGLLLVCGLGTWVWGRQSWGAPWAQPPFRRLGRLLRPIHGESSDADRRRLKAGGSQDWLPHSPSSPTARFGATPGPLANSRGSARNSTTSHGRGSSPDDAILILSWWLCQPLCLFAVSWLAGSSVFVSRYYSLALPGTALAATLWASRSLAAEAWKPAAALLGVGALLAAGQWGRVWPAHRNSDWRGAAGQVRQLAVDPATPVICPSPFVEARPPVWNPDYRLPGFLYAQLAVYPLPGRVLLFPFDDSPQAESYAAQLSSTTLAPARRFVIYGGAGQAGFWWKWLAARPELAGWSSRRAGDFGDVTVVWFAR